MEQATQMKEMDPVRINRDFYYTLALLQYEAVNYIARAEDDNIRLNRATTIIEQVQKIIITVAEENSEPSQCIPPCYPDTMWGGKKCICPRLTDDDSVGGPGSDEVSKQM